MNSAIKYFSPYVYCCHIRQQYYMEVEIVSMKNLFSDKKRSNKGILEFLSRKGFYFVLILGILIVGATVVVLTKPDFKFLNFLTNSEENFIPEDFEDYLPDIGEEYSGIGEGTDADMSKDVDGGEDEGIDADLDADADLGQDGQELVVVNDVLEEKPDKISEISNEDESSTFLAKNEEDIAKERSENKYNDVLIGKDGDIVAENTDDQAASGKVTQVEVENPDFIMPIYGNIICDFAMDKLVYSKTLEDWRVHGGIDIAATRGTAVKAVADGVILDLKNDPKLGNTIIIDHENGFKTVYSNLASLDMVLPNQIVAQGESIGSVGDTATFEIALEPHLHFEVLKGDVLVDPKLYLPEY